MDIQWSNRIKNLPPYLFAEIDAKKPASNGLKPNLDIFFTFVCKPKAAIANNMRILEISLV